MLQIRSISIFHKNSVEAFTNLELIDQNSDGVKLLILALTLHDHVALFIEAQDRRFCRPKNVVNDPEEKG